MLKRLVVLFMIAALLLPAAADAATKKKRSSSRRSSSRASAGPAVSWWGPRLGFSSSPDQFVIGGQLDFREVTPGLAISPNVEFGFGDDMTIIALNLDGHYHFAIEGSRWRPYAGAGIAISFVSFDNGPGNGDDSDTEVGGALILGAGVPTAAGNRFFSELKLGLGDVPDLKIMVGWNFRM